MMNTLLQFIARIALVIYILAAVGVLFAVRNLIEGRRRRRLAVFGLEREAAEQQLRSAVTTLITLVLLIAMVYTIDNIVVPNTELSSLQQPTPTSVVFLTQQQEPTPTAPLLLYPTVTPTVGVPPAEVEEAASGEETPNPVTDGCEIIGATISSPSPGDTVSSQVSVEGEANILNFSQYKFEVSGPSTDGSWAVVGTYRQPVPQGLLGVWDSTSLEPGDYTLRLVVLREDGSYVTPCEVPIEVTRSNANPESTTP